MHRKKTSQHKQFCESPGIIRLTRVSLVAQAVKNLPAVWKTWVSSLGWEDPLEEGMETHSRILAWRIPMDREAWWATVRGAAKSRTRLSNEAQLSTKTSNQLYSGSSKSYRHC